MVNEMEIKKVPESQEVVKVLFEQFCEDCEWGEEGCIRISGGLEVRCPVFDAVMTIVSRRIGIIKSL
jgi:hypothetical protein